MLKQILLIIIASTIITACSLPVCCPPKPACCEEVNRLARQNAIQTEVNSLCANLKAGAGPQLIINNINQVISDFHITKQNWYGHELYQYWCGKSDPLFYNLMIDMRVFNAVINEGMDINHPIVSSQGMITTLKDELNTFLNKTSNKARHAKRRQKLNERIKVLSKHRALACTDMPMLPCGKPASSTLTVAEKIYHEHYRKNHPQQNHD